MSISLWHVARIGKKNVISLVWTMGRARKDALWHMPSVMGTRDTWELQIYSFPSRGTRSWTPLEIYKMRAFFTITPPFPSPDLNSELNYIKWWCASK
jgi:hypothetical protein